MHIYFKRSGGFAGMLLLADLELSSLPADEAEAIEQVLSAVNFFELPPDLTDDSGANRFTYELKVVQEEYEHTVCFSEERTPLELDPLFRQLTILARRPKQDGASHPPSTESQ